VPVFGAFSACSNPPSARPDSRVCCNVWRYIRVEAGAHGIWPGCLHYTGRIRVGTSETVRIDESEFFELINCAMLLYTRKIENPDWLDLFVR